MFTKQCSVELDRIRWIAAFLVVIEHAKNLIFVDFRYVTDKNVLLKAFYFLCGFGHQAVIVFFVLSGMLVGGVSVRKFLNGRFDFNDYIAHRFSRIYIVLIPAAVVGWMLDLAGIIYFNGSHLYTHGGEYGIVRVYADQVDWTTLLGNLVMLQRIVVPTVGSNGPLWSLAHEWWYYSVFALFLGAVAVRHNRALQFMLAGLAVILLAILPPFVSLWFVFWLAGIVVGFIPMRGMRINRWLAYGVFIAIFAWSRYTNVMHPDRDILDNFGRDLVIAIGCVILFTAFSQASSAARPQQRIHTVLANFSYTLYLVHVPMLTFAAALLHDVFRVSFSRQPTIGSFIYFFLVIALIYCYSYVFSRFTEVHTEKLRYWLCKPQPAQMPAQSGP